jgi:hypothetical protein
MPMKNPPHPGLSVRLNCLEPFGLSVTEGGSAGRKPRRTFAFDQRSSRSICGHGNQARKGLRRNGRRVDTHAGCL